MGWSKDTHPTYHGHIRSTGSLPSLCVSCDREVKTFDFLKDPTYGVE